MCVGGGDALEACHTRLPPYPRNPRTAAAQRTHGRTAAHGPPPPARPPPQYLLLLSLSRLLSSRSSARLASPGGKLARSK